MFLERKTQTVTWMDVLVDRMGAYFLMKRNFLFSFFIVAEVILSSGCGTQQEIPKTTAFYQVVDSAGRTVELEKKPKRVVLLATAFRKFFLL